MLKPIGWAIPILFLALSPSVQEHQASEQEPTPPRLSEIKKIYVDKMPDDLDKYLVAEIMKKFKGKIQPVGKEEDADAVMSGTGETNKELAGKVTGRFFNLHDTASAAILLLDKSGKTIIWADEAGDRSLIWGVITRGGQRKVASRIIDKLDDAIRADARK